jgi:RimJ/RimL family protein N-acetyltransferase
MTSALVLENQRVKLSSLTPENSDYLLPIAKEPGLVAYSPSYLETPEALRAYVATAIREKQKNLSIPLIIYDKKAATYAGCTRYMNIDRRNKVLHIGSTWIGREFHGTGLNTHMKFLMLRHAFEKMEFEKVEFRIDERNIRSRKAVEKLGASLEGILRKNVYLTDGYKRNTCCYGILLEEWETIKSDLYQRLN